jgi:hypothetical protein
MENNQKINLTFECHQNWNKMKVTENGRYCDVCKREVFNYTDKKIADIKKQEGEACGVFLPEQVEEGLTPIKLNFISRSKYFLATAATVIGLEVHSLHGQTKDSRLPKVEIVNGDNVQRRTRLPDAVTDSTAVTPAPSESTLKRGHHPFMVIGRTRFYTTNRFPFIRIRRHYLMGKF